MCPSSRPSGCASAHVHLQTQSLCPAWLMLIKQMPPAQHLHPRLCTQYIEHLSICMMPCKAPGSCASASRADDPLPLWLPAVSLSLRRSRKQAKKTDPGMAEKRFSKADTDKLAAWHASLCKIEVRLACSQLRLIACMLRQDTACVADAGSIIKARHVSKLSGRAPLPALPLGLAMQCDLVEMIARCCQMCSCHFYCQAFALLASYFTAFSCSRCMLHA